MQDVERLTKTVVGFIDCKIDLEDCEKVENLTDENEFKKFARDISLDNSDVMRMIFEIGLDAVYKEWANDISNV